MKIEIPVGVSFYRDNVKLRCVLNPEKCCNYCYLRHKSCATFACRPVCRIDRQNVYFEKVETDSKNERSKN